ncbi:MAG TPA: D-cysteine desulfhydrase family protein [Thermomicrobiales bacterium]|nr:D-cysteine desulfhydrase family protein [Thermomicrobiales bacterium]
MSFDLYRLPRFPLANLPTPLQEASRLREALGGPAKCPRILIKRDDLTGLAFGGNKVRKLEMLVGDALVRGADTLITTGAVQSNHARATAAAAVVAGLRAILVLESADMCPPVQGNLLLDRLLQADVRFVPKDGDTAKAMETVADEVRAAGGNPYVIPIGGSSPSGAAGYLTMTLELKVQLAAMGASPSRLYFASGSRGTQAGIVLGARVFDMPYEIYGVLVSKSRPETEARALSIANEAAELVGSDVRLNSADLANVDGYFGEAYAIPTPEGDAAVLLLARTEAIFLDPTYTGKSMSALIDHIQTGQLGPDETVVFIHTGGTPAIFAHADRLSELAKA